MSLPVGTVYIRQLKNAPSLHIDVKSTEHLGKCREGQLCLQPKEWLCLHYQETKKLWDSTDD